MHIVNCAKIGADVMTGPLSAIWLLKHPLTDIGLAQFVADFEKEQVKSSIQFLYLKSKSIFKYGTFD
jgi:hypothetical protein